MKKTKIITISLLGLLMFVPLTTFAKAAVPAYVGLAVDDYFEWDHNINILESADGWALWNTDNMTDHWAEPFGQADAYASMWFIEGAVGKAGPINPIYVYSTEINDIFPDTGGIDGNWDTYINSTEKYDSPGETLINASNGYYLVGELTNLPFETSYIIGNDSASFAEDTWYGVMATSAFWAGKPGTYYFANSLFFAPTTIDWDDFAANCTDGLEAGYDLIANYSYDLKVNALSNGFQLYSAADDFGNNSEAITINVTYDSDGVMEKYSFEYGDAVLTEIVRGVTEAPIIIDPPADFSLPYDYSDESILWSVSSADPKNYAILTNDSEVLVNPTVWTIGYIEFEIPDGLTPGEDHLIMIRIADGRNNVRENEVIITVESSPPTVSNVNLIINSTSGDLVLTYTYSEGSEGDADQSDIRWYKNSTLMTAYNDLMTVPASALTGNDEWYAEITPSDGTYTNTPVTSDTVTIPEPEPTPVIPGYPIIAILGFSVIALVFVVKKRKI